MNCPVTPEEARRLQQLTHRTHELILGTAVLARDLLCLEPVSPCIKASAALHASVKLLLRQLLVHRQVHGEFSEILGLNELNGRPDVLRTLLEDLNEIMVLALRRVDPARDYAFQLASREKGKQ